MTVEYNTAIDEVYSRFKNSINDYMSTELDYTPTIFWDDEELTPTQDIDRIYYHVRHFIIRQGQVTFATDVNERQFGTTALLVVNIYIPRSLDNGQHIGRGIANYIRSLYIDSTVSGVWFRDQAVSNRTNEYDENHYHILVNVTFEYNEVFN